MRPRAQHAAGWLFSAHCCLLGWFFDVLLCFVQPSFDVRRRVVAPAGRLTFFFAKKKVSKEKR
jgi:hypothetical protein